MWYQQQHVLQVLFILTYHGLHFLEDILPNLSSLSSRINISYNYVCVMSRKCLMWGSRSLEPFSFLVHLFGWMKVYYCHAKTLAPVPLPHQWASYRSVETCQWRTRHLICNIPDPPTSEEDATMALTIRDGSPMNMWIHKNAKIECIEVEHT